MRRLLTFFKNEAMFTIALVCALLSVVFTAPSAEIIYSLNWTTLIILFMLFTVLEGMKRENLLQPVISIVSCIRGTFALSSALIAIVFLLSMFITNDVALLTFVPITILILRTAEREKYIIPVVALETIAANLGSMATPFGNPQNLFLYQKMEAESTEFILMMLPLVLISLALLAISTILLFRKKMKDEIILRPEAPEYSGDKAMKMFYLCLFFVVLATVLGALPVPYIFMMFSLMIIFFDRKILKAVDWPLMGTFLSFFVFSSAIAGNEKVAGLLSSIVSGNEFLSGLLLSQVISNVPAAILLEPFAENIKALLYGVDVGGLGTLVASLASLISFRCYTKEYPQKKGEFIKVFTLYNIAFLIVLSLAAIAMLNLI